MERQNERPIGKMAGSSALPAGLLPVADGGMTRGGRVIQMFLRLGRHRDFLPVLLLAILTFAAYQPVWHAGFVSNDDPMVLDNRLIHHADGWYRVWCNRSADDFVPATMTSFWLEWRLWGANPLGYHLDNVLLHLGSAILLWRILLRLKIPGAWLAAAIFAVHPVAVESVAWVSQRKNTLAMNFFLATVLCHLTFEKSGRWRWHWLAAGMFFLALMCKTAVVPLPVVLLGLAWWQRGRINRQDLRHTLALMALAVCGSLLAVWIQRGAGLGTVVREDGLWSRLAGAGWAVWFYLYKALVPLHLAFIYPRWQIDERNLLSYIPLALLVAALALSWRLRKTWGNGLFFGLAYFVMMLLPVLGFQNIYFMTYSLVADHWQYFAIIGPIVLAASVIRQPMLAAALLLILGALTWEQCGMYANERTLWQATVRLNPGSWVVHYSLGLALFQDGRTDEAISEYQKALEMHPDDADAHASLGTALFKKGRADEAIAEFQEALRIQPDHSIARYNLRLARLKRKK